MSLRDFLPPLLRLGEAPEPRPEIPEPPWPPPEMAWCPAPPPCLHGWPPRVLMGQGSYSLDCEYTHCGGPNCLKGGAGGETWDRAVQHWIWLLHHYRDLIPCPGTSRTLTTPSGAHRHTCPLCHGDQMILRPPDGTITTPFHPHMAEQTER